MIEKIIINSFKSLPDVEIELGMVNMFIGSNGSGKSNILEAIGVLSAAAFGKIDDESLMRRGVRPGLPSLYKTAFKNYKIKPHISLSAISGQTSYKVSLLNPLKNPKPAWEYKTESLVSNRETILSRGTKQKNKFDPALGLAALKQVELVNDDPAKQMMNTLQQYAIYCPNTDALRGVVPDGQMREPVGLSGGGLARALAELKKISRHDEYVEIALDEILSCMDWVESFDSISGATALLSPSVSRPKQILRFTDRFMRENRNTLSAYDASEGSLYLLFVAALALSPAAPAFFSIDNVDQALNPRLVKKMTTLLCEWIIQNNRQQIVCTAHNPAAIDGLNLEDDRIRLFTVNRNNKGHSQIQRVLISPELAKTAKARDWPLSRLWMMGHLGGVPNV